MGRWATTPSGAFDPERAPAAPDYANPASWAAYPGKRSRANAVPAGLERNTASPPADVFFVHPTTYFGRSWNGPVDGWLTRLITGAALAGQASAFAGVADIYAPRYRQLTLAGFDESGGREAALELAYSDVRRAFRHFLAVRGSARPLLLAGHSQGSRHLWRLLEEFFRSGPLRDELVAAYLPGARIWDGPFRRGEAAVPVCESADQVGCLVTWRTFDRSADPKLDTHGEPEDGRTVCVNPLSWRTDETRATAAENRGSIPLPMLTGPATPAPGLTGARCGDGVLWIDALPGWRYRWAHRGGNWHAYDYAAFWANVRENAAARVAAFLTSRPS